MRKLRCGKRLENSMAIPGGKGWKRGKGLPLGARWVGRRRRDGETARQRGSETEGQRDGMRASVADHSSSSHVVGASLFEFLDGSSAVECASRDVTTNCEFRSRFPEGNGKRGKWKQVRHSSVVRSSDACVVGAQLGFGAWVNARRQETVGRYGGVGPRRTR